MKPFLQPDPKSLLMVFVGGVLYALTAMSRSMLKGESFDSSKMLKTLLISGFLAVLNALSGVSLSDADALLQGAGETVLLDKALKALGSALREDEERRWLGSG